MKWVQEEKGFLKMHFMIAGTGPLDREEVLPDVVDFSTPLPNKRTRSKQKKKKERGLDPTAASRQRKRDER